MTCTRSYGADVPANPAVREFNTAAAQRWGQARAAAGVDEATVARNVSATTAFYVPAES